MSQKQNLGYDFTKKMLNTMRNLNENVVSTKKILKEEEDQKMFNLVLNDNVEVKIHSTDQQDLSLSDEEKNSLNQLIQNFKSQVSELASFEEGFNIYVDNVRLDGTIEEDLGFVLIAGNNRGLYINANMLKIEQETVEIISKLERFQHAFDDVVIERETALCSRFAVVKVVRTPAEILHLPFELPNRSLFRVIKLESNSRIQVAF